MIDFLYIIFDYIQFKYLRLTKNNLRIQLLKKMNIISILSTIMEINIKIISKYV